MVLPVYQPVPKLDLLQLVPGVLACLGSNGCNSGSHQVALFYVFIYILIYIQCGFFRVFFCWLVYQTVMQVGSSMIGLLAR